MLMDLEMKEMDGLVATGQIKSAFPEARIVITIVRGFAQSQPGNALPWVTNFDDAVLREAADRAGACGYVLKDNLLELRALLGGSMR